MKTRWLLLLGVILGVFSLAAGAADWPGWRGPQRNGLSQETGLLKEWPKDGPKLLWQVKDLGFGYSSPAVVGERLYLVSNKGMDDEFVQALRVEDGKHLWSARLGKVGRNYGPNYPGARSTPTVDGDLIFALGSDGDLACLEAATGKERWHKNLRVDFGGKPGQWAYSESPLIDGDVLVCTPGGREATLVALDKKTGEVRWKCAVPGGDQAAYASAIVVETGGTKQYVQFLAKGVVGLDAKTGKFLWRYEHTAKGSPANIPTPVWQGDYIYTGTSMAGAGLVKLKNSSGGIEAEQVYFEKTLPNAIGGSVLVGEYLYGTTGKGLSCVAFTSGQVKWQDKCIGPGSLCYADGCLYVHGENGQVALVEATPEGYHEKGRFTPPDQPDHSKTRSKAWEYPVVANGRLYIHDIGTLWAYDVSAKGH
jgi:outer membrane protein assembly factor BamB